MCSLVPAPPPTGPPAGPPLLPLLGVVLWLVLVEAVVPEVPGAAAQALIKLASINKTAKVDNIRFISLMVSPFFRFARSRQD